MAKSFKNTYREEGDYLVGVTKNNTEYKIDKEDYEKLKDIPCSNWNGMMQAHIHGVGTVQISRYLLGIKRGDKCKVSHLNGDQFDLRKENLWTGNKYIFADDYIQCLCRNGKSFLIDKEDYELVSKYSWHVDVNNYVISERMENGKPVKLHRLILDIVDKPWLEVDHLYHDTCDNRKKNLKIVSRSRNCLNRKPNKSNTSGTVGVYRMSGYEDKWCVQINIDGKRKYLGSYPSYELAVAARQKAEQEALVFVHLEY